MLHRVYTCLTRDETLDTDRTTSLEHGHTATSHTYVYTYTDRLIHIIPARGSNVSSVLCCVHVWVPVSLCCSCSCACVATVTCRGGSDKEEEEEVEDARTNDMEDGGSEALLLPLLVGTMLLMALLWLARTDLSNENLQQRT